jgi:Ni/Co efflux regulator RcnB
MSKLLSILIAAAFAAVSAGSFAADAPKKEEKKAEAKVEKKEEKKEEKKDEKKAEAKVEKKDEKAGCGPPFFLCARHGRTLVEAAAMGSEAITKSNLVKPGMRGRPFQPAPDACGLGSARRQTLASQGCCSMGKPDGR